MLRIILLLFALLSLGACSTAMLTQRFADNLGDAILSQTDPEIAATSLPTFLVLLDSLVINSPDNPAILSASADLNGAYASLFVDDDKRATKLADKAFEQARTAICIDVNSICTQGSTLEQFQQSLQAVDSKNTKELYSFGSAWAGWIQSHRDDWNALAQVPRVEAVMKRVIELNEGHAWGRAHLFLAVINSQLPLSLGGKPEIGRMHFEKAIEISEGNDLLVKVEYARHYARLMFDQSLHDRLLNEVLNDQPEITQLNLSNAIARQQATELLQTSAEYFEE